MIEETLHAANWWVKRIISYNISVEAPSWQSHFEKVMTELLRAKYHNHWYKDEPLRGSGYRAISNAYSLDPILDKAARAVSHSLPKNLALKVLTSDDRWLVMFVNPGEVTVRDKQYQEDVIYDKVNHIYNSSLKNKSTNFNNKYNKSSSKSRSSLSSNASYSKSDDETLSTLDETKCDDNNLTKSDGEDSGTPNKNENGTVDYRKLFLQNIHNAARRNKEKEIEAYVQEYKEEMRKNHRKKFGPYDDEDNNSKYNKSPSKSSTTGSTTTNTNTTSTSSSPSRSSINNTPNKSSSNNNKSNEQKRSRSHSPRSPANDYDKDKDGENNNKPKSGNKQILNVLNSLTLSKLNGFNHRNGISIDMNTSNYGKHLKQILNSCKIHTRNQLQNDNRNNNNKHKNGTILNNHHNNSNTKNGKINNSNKLNIDNDDYMLTMNGEYPSLFPMSFASPSPSISPMITPSPSPLDLDDGPQQLKHSKSQPITSDNNNRINNHYQPLQKMKSMGLIDNDFELHMNASSDEEDDIFPQQSIFNKLNKQSQSYPEHEEDQNSEIAMNTNASQIYDSSSPQFLQNEMQNASPSSHGSKLAMQDLDLDGCEDLKY